MRECRGLSASRTLDRLHAAPRPLHSIEAAIHNGLRYGTREGIGNEVHVRPREVAMNLRRCYLSELSRN